VDGFPAQQLARLDHVKLEQGADVDASIYEYLNDMDMRFLCPGLQTRGEGTLLVLFFFKHFPHLCGGEASFLASSGAGPL
jgi:hypothetical protein